jgi:hypothetical protein
MKRITPYIIAALIAVITMNANKATATEVIIYQEKSIKTKLSDEYIEGWQCNVNNTELSRIIGNEYTKIELEPGKYYVVCDREKMDDVKKKIEVKNDTVILEINISPFWFNGIKRHFELPEDFKEYTEK